MLDCELMENTLQPKEKKLFSRLPTTNLLFRLGIFLLLFIFPLFFVLSQLATRKEKAETRVYSYQSNSSPFFQYDFEVKNINPGDDLIFILNTNTDTINNLPNGTPIEFTLLSRRAEGLSSEEREMFGLAGIQGEWDLTTSHLNFHKKYYHQEGDETLTPLKMLEKNFALHAALGVEWVGMEFYWEQNSQDGPVNFDNFDKIFRIAKKYNLKILPMMDKTPRWATPLTCTDSSTDGYPSCKSRTSCVPKDLTTNGSEYYNNFLRQAVERYKPHGQYYQETGEPDEGYGITHWVIWNEPNHISGNFWTDCARATAIFKNAAGQDINQYDAGYRPVASIEDYARLFKGAYQTIKQADPNAKVLMAGFAGIGPSDSNKKEENTTKFFSELNRIGGSKPDIWNAHIYQASSKNFMWEMGTIVNLRNQLDAGKEIWVSEFGYYRAFHLPTVQETIINDTFAQKSQLKNWNVTKLLYWTGKGYIMCDPSVAGCIPYTDITSCRSFPYTGCGGKPYGALEMGTLLLSPNFYPDPVYLDYGKQLKTIVQVGSNVKTTVSQNQIIARIPASYFQTGEEYILIMSSPSKIVTTKPWIVRVGSGSTPPPEISPSATPTPNLGISPSPTPTPTPAPTTSQCPSQCPTITFQKLGCTASGCNLKLNWNAIPGATSYDTYRNNIKYGSDIIGTSYTFSWIPAKIASFKVIPKAAGCPVIDCSGLYINPQ
jgi:hypothetical protein